MITSELDVISKTIIYIVHIYYSDCVCCM